MRRLEWVARICKREPAGEKHLRTVDSFRRGCSVEPLAIGGSHWIGVPKMAPAGGTFYTQVQLRGLRGWTSTAQGSGRRRLWLSSGSRVGKQCRP